MAVMRAKIFNVDYPKDFRKKETKKKIAEMVSKVKVPDFVPNKEKAKAIADVNNLRNN